MAGVGGGGWMGGRGRVELTGECGRWELGTGRGLRVKGALEWVFAPPVGCSLPG